MNDRLLALSADLWRISYWLVSGSQKMADKFLKRDIDLYKDIDIEIGKRRLQEELSKVARLDGGQEKAAERALTLSVLLMHRGGV